MIECDVDVSGKFITKPNPETVTVGSNVTMLCKSDIDVPVNWNWKTSSSPSETKRICYRGVISSDFTHKYSIDTGPTVEQPEYNLIIHNADLSDAGEYTCIERAGLGGGDVEAGEGVASANLTVIQHPNSGKVSWSLRI